MIGSVAFTYSSNEGAANALVERLGPAVIGYQADVRDFERLGKWWPKRLRNTVHYRRW